MQSLKDLPKPAGKPAFTGTDDRCPASVSISARQPGRTGFSPWDSLPWWHQMNDTWMVICVYFQAGLRIRFSVKYELMLKKTKTKHSCIKKRRSLIRGGVDSSVPVLLLPCSDKPSQLKELPVFRVWWVHIYTHTCMCSICCQHVMDEMCPFKQHFIWVPVTLCCRLKPHDNVWTSTRGKDGPYFNMTLSKLLLGADLMINKLHMYL